MTDRSVTSRSYMPLNERKARKVLDSVDCNAIKLYGALIPGIYSPFDCNGQTQLLEGFRVSRFVQVQLWKFVSGYLFK